MPYGDVYSVISTLNPQTKFFDMPPAIMLGISHLVEAYYLFRLLHPAVTRILPDLYVRIAYTSPLFHPIHITPSTQGPLTFFQPSLFNLIQVHLIFDDSRARKSPQEGGLGYNAPFSSLEALCKLVIEWQTEGKREDEKRVVGGRISFGTVTPVQTTFFGKR